jgi:hypothetical protein
MKNAGTLPGIIPDILSAHTPDPEQNHLAPYMILYKTYNNITIQIKTIKYTSKNC